MILIYLDRPRIFNSGSPYNIPAGSSANLEELKAHYQRKGLEAEEGRMARLTAAQGDSETLARRREAEGVQPTRPTSISSVLEDWGFKRPQK